MQAYRLETTLQENGTLTLHNLPLPAGETVEVIILVSAPPKQNDYPLWGQPVTLLDPTKPVADTDWEAIQ